MNNDPNSYLRNLQHIATEQDRAKFASLVATFRSTLERLPKMREEIDAYLAPEQALNYISLIDRIEPKLEQAAAFLAQLDTLPDHLKNDDEILAFAQATSSTLTSGQLLGVEDKLQALCLAVRERQEAEEARRIQAEKNAERKRAAEEEAKRKLAKEEAKRKLAKEEAKRKLAKEEAKRKQAEDEAKRKQALKEAKRKRTAEAEALRKQAENEAQLKLAEEEAKRKQADDEITFWGKLGAINGALIIGGFGVYHNPHGAIIAALMFGLIGGVCGFLIGALIANIINASKSYK